MKGLSRSQQEDLALVAKGFLRSLLILLRNQTFMAMSFAWALHTATVGVFAHFGPKVRRQRAPSPRYLRSAPELIPVFAVCDGDVQPQGRGPRHRGYHGAADWPYNPPQSARSLIPAGNEGRTD